MIVLMAIFIMGVRMAAVLNGHEIDLPKMYSTLGHCLCRQLAHSIRMPAQQCDFHTMMVIEPRAHGGNCEVVVLMLRTI